MTQPTKSPKTPSDVGRAGSNPRPADSRACCRRGRTIRRPAPAPNGVPRSTTSWRIWRILSAARSPVPNLNLAAVHALADLHEQRDRAADAQLRERLNVLDRVQGIVEPAPDAQYRSDHRRGPAAGVRSLRLRSRRAVRCAATSYSPSRSGSTAIRRQPLGCWNSVARTLPSSPRPFSNPR